MQYSFDHSSMMRFQLGVQYSFWTRLMPEKRGGMKLPHKNHIVKDNQHPEISTNLKSIAVISQIIQGILYETYYEQHEKYISKAFSTNCKAFLNLPSLHQDQISHESVSNHTLSPITLQQQNHFRESEKQQISTECLLNAEIISKFYTSSQNQLLNSYKLT